jgi:hypothetical protein
MRRSAPVALVVAPEKVCEGVAAGAVGAAGAGRHWYSAVGPDVEQQWRAAVPQLVPLVWPLPVWSLVPVLVVVPVHTAPAPMQQSPGAATAAGHCTATAGRARAASARTARNAPR